MTLRIERAVGLVTIQDLGRPGRMHEALAPGGALVPELLVAANRAARNPDGAPALEVLGKLIVRADVDLVVATDAPRMLRAGDELSVTSEPRRVAYLALRGGITAPLVLGGRATQLSAGIGAALRAGDWLSSAALAIRDADPAIWPPDDAAGHATIAVIAGPDQSAFAGGLAALMAQPFRISPTSDRIGTRLEGAKIPRLGHVTEQSRPMVRGAIEVPGDGNPIVLGPEHPTTGGYPVVAVIAHADLGRFFAIRLGGQVRFTPVRSAR